MKKILYVVKYLPDACNSVGDILKCMVDLPQMKNYEQVIAQCDGHSFSFLDVSYKDKCKYYNAEIISIKEIISNKKINLLKKIKLIFNKIKLFIIQKLNKSERFLQKTNEDYLIKIIKDEQPDLVVFFVYSPQKRYAEICKESNTKYAYMLYDTFLARPGVDKKVCSIKEKYVIENSEAYFVPSFFADDYYNEYGRGKIIGFDLPLLVEKEDVETAYKNKKIFEFSYFGQIQNFRNGDKIRQIFVKLGIKLDVFTSSYECESDETFVIHNVLKGNELYSAVAGSKFLVAFDNSVPYNMFLPSKACLYVSFTKPIIIFGDNDKSALKDFLKDYPKCYYQNINEPSDGLLEFINNNQKSEFDEKIYSEYLNYLPCNSLKKFAEFIQKII